MALKMDYHHCGVQLSNSSRLCYAALVLMLKVQSHKVVDGRNVLEFARTPTKDHQIQSA
jgi:hypothetical protein